MKKASHFYKKNKQIILYIFFGVCTTVINGVCYEVLYKCANVSNMTSTLIAWFIAVSFAFITNKEYVFDAERRCFKRRLNQFVLFFLCRVFTGILDVIIMVLAVDFLKLNSLLWKFISNIIITIINYVLSKFFIFKNPTEIWSCLNTKNKL